MKLPPKDLREALHYDPETGIFTWLRTNSNRAKAGTVAGNPHPKLGYIRIQIDGIQYGAHQLAWFYVYSEWPKLIDHINGNTGDNRITNLRKASISENLANSKVHYNSTSKLKGARIQRYGNRTYWVSRINKDRKSYYLGIFDNPEDAHAAYCEAAKRLYGEFARFE